jgi:hypothetical protein
LLNGAQSTKHDKLATIAEKKSAIDNRIRAIYVIYVFRSVFCVFFKCVLFHCADRYHNCRIVLHWSSWPNILYGLSIIRHIRKYKLYLQTYVKKRLDHLYVAIWQYGILRNIRIRVCIRIIRRRPFIPIKKQLLAILLQHQMCVCFHRISNKVDCPQRWSGRHKSHIQNILANKISSAGHRIFYRHCLSQN